MSRNNVSIVTGYNADPAEMRAMDTAEERLAWMDRHLVVKHRSGKWSKEAMGKIAQRAGIRYEMEISIK